jgi:DNA-binding CsgD family transcriptional regulator
MDVSVQKEEDVEQSDSVLFGPDETEPRKIACDRDGIPLPGTRLLEKMPYVPFAFLGLGIYRAWIELVFVGSFVQFPFVVFAGHDAFDVVMIAVMFACAAAAHRIGPFFRHRSVYWLAGLSLTVSTICAFLSIFFPAWAAQLALPATVLGGFGIAITILLWSELYSCLNPYRVGLYYSASIVMAALILYLCRGLSTPWLFAMGLVLPAASLVCCSLGYIALPKRELPHSASARFSFPWKPTLLMAIYAFAYGLRESSQYASSFGPHSAFGTLAVGAVVFALIYARRRSFDFSIIYRIALPLMVGAFLVLPAFGTLSDSVSNFCAMAGYTAFSILIMLILANMSYRYGISAIWLFGIERGVRALFSLFGRQLVDFISIEAPDFDVTLVIGSLTILLVVAGSMILFSEKELSSRWGVSFRGSSEEADGRASVKRHSLADRCHDLAVRYELSQREEEVLLQLAQRKTVSTIERELFIAKDTAKTHIRHIYRKMDIHSRDELFDVLGVGGK